MTGSKWWLTLLVNSLRCACVCVKREKSTVPRDGLLNWETILSIIFFLIMHLTNRSDRAFHFCVPNMMGFHNLASVELNRDTLWSSFHTHIQCLGGVWVDGSSDVWIMTCMCAGVCMSACPEGVLSISHFLSTHHLLPLSLSGLLLLYLIGNNILNNNLRRF